MDDMFAIHGFMCGELRGNTTHHARRTCRLAEWSRCNPGADVQGVELAAVETNPRFASECQP
jgi:hypothetical protein